MSNDTIDRFYNVIEVLEFHAKEQKTRKNAGIVGSEIKQENVEKLVAMVLQRIKMNKNKTLLEPLSLMQHRFSLKLEHLLNPKQKHTYYNTLL